MKTRQRGRQDRERLRKDEKKGSVVGLANQEACPEFVAQKGKCKPFSFVLFVLLPTHTHTLTHTHTHSLSHTLSHTLSVTVSMSEHTMHCVVTGGNRGIGLAICKALVKASKHNVVWMGARNAALAEKEFLLHSNQDDWDNRLRVLPLDVTSQESVEAAAKQLKDHDVQVSVLINNAGVALDLPWSQGKPTAEKCTTTMAVNVAGVQRVFHAMRPLLAERARVVAVSSGAGPLNMEKMSDARQKALLADDLREDTIDGLVAEFCAEYKQAVEDDSCTLPCASPSGWWLQAYGFSKAVVNALTRIWARDHPELHITCCTPGLVDTDMVASYKGDSKKKSPQEGAATPVWLATAPATEVQTGCFYGNGNTLKPWVGYQS